LKWEKWPAFFDWGERAFLRLSAKIYLFWAILPTSPVPFTNGALAV
jgi:hypothetical protein